MALKPIMTDAEIKRRKKLQGRVSQTTSTLGLGALALKGVSVAAPRFGKLGASGAKIGHSAEKAATNALIGSAGIGGLGGYNFAAYTKAEARKRPARPAAQTTVKKEFTMVDMGNTINPHGDAQRGREAEVTKALTREDRKHMDQTANRSVLGGVAGGAAVGAAAPRVQASHKASQALHSVGMSKGDALRSGFKAGSRVRGMPGAGALGGLVAGTAVGATLNSRYAKKQRVKKNTEIFSEVSKLGSPKVRMQGIGTVSDDGDVNRSDTSEATYKGKSAILRRPKYQVVAYNKAGMESARQGRKLVAVSGNMRLHRDDAKRVHAAYKGGKKKITYSTGEKNNLVRKNTEIFKAYDPERNRQRRLDHGATGFAVGAGATAAGAVIHGKRAYKPLKAIAGTKRGKAAFGHGGTAAVLTGTTIGAAVASDRIRSYKSKRGGSFTPLRNYQP